MATLDQIEDSIRALPAGDFIRLAEWMCEHHLEVISAEGFESMELEAEMLKGLQGPRHPVDGSFYEGIRHSRKDPANR